MDSADFILQINSKVNDQKNSELEKEVTSEEIRETVWSMHPEKALGPDGFTIAFYKSHWETIQKDLVCMIKNVFKTHKVTGKYKNFTLGSYPEGAKPSLR